MPPQLGPPFAIEWNGRPPHMSQKDWTLWRRYRSTHSPPFARLYYDVALGGAAETVGQDDPRVGPMWKRLTAFRADVVGETPTSWTIIELRDNAGPGAIGSLTCYRDLWIADPPDARPLSLVLITDQIAPELLPTIRDLGAQLITV